MFKRFAMVAVAAGLFVAGGDLYAQCSKSCSKEKSASCSQKNEGATISQIQTVTKDELKELIGAEQIVLIDARDADSYNAGHIEGAINFGQAELPADKNAVLVFYCGGTKCPAASKAAKQAAEMGYTQVKVFTEGWSGWSAS